MNASLPRSLFLVAALALATASPASASIARAVSFDEKVASAERVIVGKVVSQRSGTDPSGRWIVTWSTFEVESALKGTAPRHLTVMTPGGSHEGIRQETIGSPEFREGAEHVIFVDDTETGPAVAFLDQGVYDITRDSGGRAMVKPTSSQLILVESATGKAASATGETSAAVGLDQFQSRIQDSMRRNEQRALQMQALRAEPARSEPEQVSIRDFASEHWKILLLLGLGLILAVVPFLWRLTR
ncbi:MAG: hypothetical protein ABR517_09335 [Thermoanaerobaculia bacterium]